jgi:hypothetical protein
VSPTRLASRHGFEPHFLHRFLTFYADLIKWIDGLTDWPICAIVVAHVHLARVGRCYADLIKWIDGLTGWLVCAVVVAHVHLAHVGRRYADLIKWIDGLTDWPDTVSRPT